MQAKLPLKTVSGMHLGFTPLAQPLGSASQQQKVWGGEIGHETWVQTLPSPAPEGYREQPGWDRAVLKQRGKGNSLGNSSVRVLGRAVRVTGALRVLINSGHLTKCSLTMDLLGGRISGIVLLLLLPRKYFPDSLC